MALPEEIVTAAHKEVAGLVGWGVAGAGGLWFGLRRLMRITGADKVESTSSDAQVNIIKLMENQLDRLASQNVVLTNAIRDLQIEVFQLRDENATLRRHLGLPEVDKVSRAYIPPIAPAPAP